MKLLVVRHGAAMDQEEFARTGQSDDLRPLTSDGEKEMRRVAAGLRAEIGALDVLASSPLVRARQTADIVAAAFGMATPSITGVHGGERCIEELVIGRPHERIVDHFGAEQRRMLEIGAIESDLVRNSVDDDVVFSGDAHAGDVQGHVFGGDSRVPAIHLFDERGRERPLSANEKADLLVHWGSAP